MATLLLWLACGFTFGNYLADFANSHATYYAGLASAMIALVYLYYSAWIFVFGGELNAVIARYRARAMAMDQCASSVRLCTMMAPAV